jgi:hypothetical protein
MFQLGYIARKIPANILKQADGLHLFSSFYLTPHYLPRILWLGIHSHSICHFLFCFQFSYLHVLHGSLSAHDRSKKNRRASDATVGLSLVHTISSLGAFAAPIMNGSTPDGRKFKIGHWIIREIFLGSA